MSHPNTNTTDIGLREAQLAVLDTSVVAAGLRECASVCSAEQQSLKSRLELAARVLERVPDIAELIGTVQAAARIIHRNGFADTAKEIQAVATRAIAKVVLS